MLPEQQQRIMGYFIEEAKDHLNTIEQGLLSLQTTIEDGEKANEVFRAAHSVKGGAAMLGLESIQTIAHRMEDYFKILKESPVTVDSTLETMFLRVSDGLKDLLEQLEGPFGLTPEKAQEIMADVDPVFSQLETHLNSLVAASGTSGGGASVSGSANADAIQVIFKQDVSGLLRQLLSTFKQADTAESRKNLQDVCTQLSAIGQQFELSAWCDLIETARLAAEEPSNEYKVLAPILIKEIKKSQDLVLAGRAFEVGVSETMQALLPDDILATVDTLQNDADNFDSLGLASGDETASEIETELFSESPAVEDDLFADGLFDAEIDTDTEDLNELFGLNSNSAEPLYEGVEPESQLDTNSELEVAEATDEIDINSLSTDGLDPDNLDSTQSSLNLEESLDAKSLNEKSLDSFELESAPSPEEEAPTNRLNVDLDFNEIPSELSALNRNANVEEKADESLDALLATVNVTGPDVGTEELNSLADLFDGDLEELDNTLGGHPFVSEEMRLHPERIDLDEEEDFTDLLADDSHSEESGEEGVTETEEEEDDLFGGTLTEGGFADISELNLDEALLDEASIDSAVDESTLNSENSLNNELAALEEDPWAEEENELEDLFSEGAESLAVDSDSISIESIDESVEQIQIETETEEHESAAITDAEEEETEGDEEEETEGDEEIVEDTVSSIVREIDTTQPPGNLSSGLFAAEPVSPSEDEIEFPTLTGVKLEEAEKDIDSFFLDSLVDEEDVILADDGELTYASISGDEESATESTQEALSDDPWGEIEVKEAQLDAAPFFEADESLEKELSATELTGSEFVEMQSASAGDDSTDELDLPTTGSGIHNTFSEVTTGEGLADDLFDLDESLLDTSEQAIDTEQSGSELAELLTVEEVSTVAEESPDKADEEEANSLWDDFSLSSDENTAAAFALELNSTEAETETVFSATPISEENFDFEGEADSLFANDVEDDFLSELEESESAGQSSAEVPSSLEVDSSDETDLVNSEALGNLFDESEDSVELSVKGSSENEEDSFLSLDEMQDSSEGEAADSDFLLDFEGTESNDAAERLSQQPQEHEPHEQQSPHIGEAVNVASIGETTGTEVAADDELSFDDLDSLLDDDSEPTAAVAGNGTTLNETVSTAVSESPSEEELEDEEDFDDLERLLEEGDGETASPSVSPRRTAARATRRSAPAREQNMRVPVKHLDNLSNLVGELVVNRNTLERDQERLRQFLDNLLFQVQQLNDVGQRMRDLYERSLLESSLVSNRKAYAANNNQKQQEESENHATGATFDALEMDRFTGFHTLSQEMIELIVRVRESSSDIGYTVESSDQVTRQFRQVTTQLQEGLNTARMVAFSQAADRLPRAVRDISLKCGKEARLVVEGKDTLIDKMIVEHLYDPLTHLVNNAITHGIETPEERKAAGKLPEGSITVQAFYQGNQTVIYVADDGGGINTAFVQRKAVEKKLITQAEADQLSDIETYELLFHAGFSTRDQADDFAGRGVGMDVVRTSLAEIRGVITIDSEKGKGTSFTIRLPLTLSISKALSCVSNQARIAFPMDGVEDMLDVPRDRIIQNEEGLDCVKWRDRTLPFQAITDLLKFNRTLGRGRVYGGGQDDDVLSIIVLRSANTYVAVQVDQVIGEEEIVIKQLEGPVPKPLGIAGATILGDGRVMPIADVLELIDIAMGRVRREPASLLWAEAAAEAEAEVTAKTDPTVLIVDDSITVRELLSMSFNKVGYRVEQARDGQEAWDKLRSGLPCDLVFCDIEMPRMDGLELLSRMQKDNHLKQVPIAMLTSRGADRHRQMAVDLGASGYFTKPYLEEALLDAAQRMLNGETLAKGRGG